MLRRVAKKPRSVAACIDSVIPRTDTFSDLDIVASLEALDPGRVWKERTIHCHLSKLREKGIIRRLKRATQASYTVYVRAEIPVMVQPLDDMPLREVVKMVLAEARWFAARRLKEHNEERPHSSLGYRTPAEFASQRAASVTAPAAPTPPLQRHTAVPATQPLLS